MVSNISLICPGCRASLTLPADKADNEKLILLCPKCQYKGVVKSFVRLQNQQLVENSEPTIIVGHNLREALAIGRLKEVKTNKLFSLKQGSNRFGRKSPNSVCEHQFTTEDTFISRKHFEINVIFNKASLVYDHRLNDLGSTNGTLLNGQKLVKGDIILLNPGDKIVAGKTELIFEQPILPDDTSVY